MASVIRTNGAFGFCGFGLLFLSIVFFIKYFYYGYKYDMSLWGQHLEKAKELALSPFSIYRYLGYRSVQNLYKSFDLEDTELIRLKTKAKMSFNYALVFMVASFFVPVIIVIIASIATTINC
jgi:hypothetical protein